MKNASNVESKTPSPSLKPDSRLLTRNGLQKLWLYVLFFCCLCVGQCLLRGSRELKFGRELKLCRLFVFSCLFSRGKFSLPSSVCGDYGHLWCLLTPCLFISLLPRLDTVHVVVSHFYVKSFFVFSCQGCKGSRSGEQWEQRGNKWRHVTGEWYFLSMFWIFLQFLFFCFCIFVSVDVRVKLRR